MHPSTPIHPRTRKTNPYGFVLPSTNPTCSTYVNRTLPHPLLDSSAFFLTANPPIHSHTPSTPIPSQLPLPMLTGLLPIHYLTFSTFFDSQPTLPLPYTHPHGKRTRMGLFSPSSHPTPSTYVSWPLTHLFLDAHGFFFSQQTHLSTPILHSIYFI